MIVDQDNENDLKGFAHRYSMSFDFQDNIFICIMGNKLRQIRRREGESRDIDLPGIQQAYNIVIHPTGGKVLILDRNRKFHVYKVL